uniref:BPTI/Kunitz inhibitor domain-containing protein n=1 Tax=Periophthalmus magnuspinnatus TaxID=409849 RepID=A0A3B4A8X2_9GOBI
TRTLLLSDVIVFSGWEGCLEPMKEGSCSEYTLLWYFHSASGDCRPFVYGGCGGNKNRFISRQECQLRCETRQKGTTW